MNKDFRRVYSRGIQSSIWAAIPRRTFRELEAFCDINGWTMKWNQHRLLTENLLILWSPWRHNNGVRMIVLRQVIITLVTYGWRELAVRQLRELVCLLSHACGRVNALHKRKWLRDSHHRNFFQTRFGNPISSLYAGQRFLLRPCWLSSIFTRRNNIKNWHSAWHVGIVAHDPFIVQYCISWIPKTINCIFLKDWITNLTECV